MSRPAAPKLTLALIAGAAALGAASSASLPAAAHHGLHFNCCFEPEQTEARRGETVYGYTIPGYVFNRADRNNDGVLRGRELRRARNIAIQLEKSGKRRRRLY